MGSRSEPGESGLMRPSAKVTRTTVVNFLTAGAYVRMFLEFREWRYMRGCSREQMRVG